MNTARPERLKCLSRKKKTVYIACVTKMSWQLVSTILGEKRRDRGTGTRLCYYLKSLRSKVKAVQLVLSNNRKT